MQKILNNFKHKKAKRDVWLFDMKRDAL
jgi:hypothetical protein